jgi:heme exporter protein A
MSLFLEIDDLACIRGDRVLFRGLGFAVEAGKVLALEGPNGVGKTSLLRVLAGFLAPAAGTIRLRTKARDVLDAEHRGKLVGWLGHQDGVKPQLRVHEQLSFYARLYGAGDVDAAMARFGLVPLAALPGQYLSAGQKRRLALARLVLMGRPLWLLDEPLAALDTAGKALVAGAVTAHCAAGGIAIAATHESLGICCGTLRLEGVV